MGTTASLRNNHIIGGKYGFFYRNDDTYGKVIFENNTIQNSYFGVEIINEDTIIIANNTVENNLSARSTLYVDINTNYVTGRIGISAYASPNRAYIYNNIVDVESYGIIVNAYNNVYHNTVRTKTYGALHLFNISGLKDSSNVVNNIFIGDSTNVFYVLGYLSPSFYIDYNIYMTKDTTQGIVHTETIWNNNHYNLSSWKQLNPTWNTHSIQLIDTSFLNWTDLTIKYGAAVDAGADLGILTDIEGQSRPQLGNAPEPQCPRPASASGLPQSSGLSIRQSQLFRFHPSRPWQCPSLIPAHPEIRLKAVESRRIA